jgi:hypothetical protein
MAALEAVMKTMKRNRMVGTMLPGLSGMAVHQRFRLCFLAMRSLAACALVVQCGGLARAADQPPAKESATQIAPAPKPTYTPAGRQMERYKDFARQVKLPAITVTNVAAIEVGDTVQADLKRLGQLSDREKAALAGQFGVPADVIGKLMERAATNSAPGADRVAQDIRTAVIDYRFLQREWEQYHPPADGQKVKAEALAALQAGDVSKAWELYDGLQRPAPPSGLRIISQP